MEQLPLKTHWYTDRGRRPSNEDAVIVEALFGDRDLVAVADGMGGHAGGEVASGKALETLLSCLESSNDLAGAIREANTALQRASEANPEWRGMGTTLVALLRVGERYYVANVGDSRAYRIDADGIRRITEDHSFTAEAVSSGRLSEDEAERSPWRNALTRAVGTDAEVEVDVFGPFELEPPHVVVLCTDGLYRVMSDEELGSEVLSGRERVDGARDLVANALRRGSSDNISVALVEFGDPTALKSVEVQSAAGAAPVAAPPPVHADALRTIEAEAEVEVAPGSVEAQESAPEPVEEDRVPGTAGDGDPDASLVAPPESTAEDPIPLVSSQEASLEAPTEGVPSEPAPMERGPVEPVPGEEAPVEEVPIAEAPVEEVPSEPAPVEEEPAATGDAFDLEAGPALSGQPVSSAPTGPAASRPGTESAGGSATPSATVDSEPAAVPEEPPIQEAHVTSSHRKAKPARPHHKRRPPRQPRKLPSWVKREAVPAAILVLGTLAIVYVLTSVFG